MTHQDLCLSRFILKNLRMKRYPQLVGNNRNQTSKECELCKNSLANNSKNLSHRACERQDPSGIIIFFMRIIRKANSGNYIAYITRSEHLMHYPLESEMCQIPRELDAFSQITKAALNLLLASKIVHLVIYKCYEFLLRMDAHFSID